MKEIFMRNLKLKILALLLSLLAWIYVHSVSSSAFLIPNLFSKEDTITLNVEYENLEDNLKLVERTDKVEVVIKEQFYNFGHSVIRAYVDLSEIDKKGSYFFEIQIELSEWIRLLDQNPKFASIYVEEVDK